MLRSIPEAVVTIASKANFSEAGRVGAVEPPLLTNFGDDNGPRVLGIIRPVYPLRARHLGREGRVVLKLMLSKTGQLQSSEVIKSAGYGFDESALSAVGQAKFAPGTRNHRPVACEVLLPVRFHLDTR